MTPRKPAVYALSAAASRDVDRVAIEQYAMSSLALMENAAQGACRVALRMLARMNLRRCVIACGPGNNGGDGLALTRLLHNAGVRVEVWMPGDLSGRASQDHAVQLATARAMGLTIRSVSGRTPRGTRRTLWVDALFGTGLTRAITGDAAILIAAMHRGRSLAGRVLALDVPSGLDADTGNVIAAGSPCVHADATATFAGVKLAMLRDGPQRSAFGRIHLVDIGVPRAILAKLGKRVRADVALA